MELNLVDLKIRADELINSVLDLIREKSIANQDVTIANNLIARLKAVADGAAEIVMKPPVTLPDDDATPTSSPR